MRALRVRRLCLWLRFEAGVQEALRRHAPELVEWEQDASPAMGRIQARALFFFLPPGSFCFFFGVASCLLSLSRAALWRKREIFPPSHPSARPLPNSRIRNESHQKQLAQTHKKNNPGNPHRHRHRRQPPVEQEALAEVLAGCVAELRRCNRSLDTSDWNLDEALLRSFDRQARAFVVCCVFVCCAC